MISEVFNIDCMEYRLGYWVSTSGIVFSMRSMRFIKPIIMKNGYSAIMINRKMIPIHRMVAELFLPNRQGNVVVNHKNGIKTDNRIENLEWVTHRENLKHAYDNGLNNRRKPINRFSMDGIFEKHYKSAREAEADGYSNQNIAHCCNGKRKSHKGKIWKYADQ